MGITKKRLWRAQGFDLSVLNDVDQSECSEAASRRSEAKRSDCPQISAGFTWKPVGLFTLWLFNIAMENGPFIDGLPINSMMDLSMAMLVITRW